MAESVAVGRAPGHRRDGEERRAEDDVVGGVGEDAQEGEDPRSAVLHPFPAAPPVAEQTLDAPGPPGEPGGATAGPQRRRGAHAAAAGRPTAPYSRRALSVAVSVRAPSRMTTRTS